MTKLTIQLDWKTYKTKPHTQWESTVAYTIETLIGKWYLVELQPQEEKTDTQRLAEAVERDFGQEEKPEQSILLMKNFKSFPPQIPDIHYQQCIYELSKQVEYLTNIIFRHERKWKKETRIWTLRGFLLWQEKFFPWLKTADIVAYYRALAPMKFTVKKTSAWVFVTRIK